VIVIGGVMGVIVIGGVMGVIEGVMGASGPIGGLIGGNGLTICAWTEHGPQKRTRATSIATGFRGLSISTLPEDWTRLGAVMTRRR
jgi:hypothetical protein